jgi:cis-3-alkyl-4-acyloxetan-2-one decarboxylase
MRLSKPTFWDTAWHKWLKRPYKLARTFDFGSGQPVVLLHGLASSSEAWALVRAELQGKPFRVLAYDLLGFGVSPKPDWLRYTTDDHARMLIAALSRSRLKQPAILVGHSMGCLVAVRVARLRPDLVKHLILYEMPLYSGLPDKRRYRLRLNLYFKLYEKIIAYRPIFKGPGIGKAQRIAERFGGFRFNDNSWKPFIKSLKHTIMEQTTADDLKYVRMPMDVIYGSRDRVVIRGKTKAIFGEDATHITAHTIRASHHISKKASSFLVERIEAAVKGNIVTP